MRIVWVSPWGDGWALAYRLREAGNRVVYASDSTNGQGYLPQVPMKAYLEYARRADLVVVDGNWASRPTRRSWSPSDEVLALQQLRREGISVIGPTPTTELLENDTRYARKALRRLGISEARPPGNPVPQPVVRLVLSRDPAGNASLVFRHRHLLADSNGPEIGNLGDVVLHVDSNQPLVQRIAKPFEGLLKRVAFTSHLNLDLALTAVDAQVCALQTRFIYPAIFAQFADLLGTGEVPHEVGIAITLLNLNSDNVSPIEGFCDIPGFYGAEIHRAFERGDTSISHGRFVGATVSLGSAWATVQQKVKNQLSALVRDGLGFRPNIGDTVHSSLSLLKEWGYLT